MGSDQNVGVTGVLKVYFPLKGFGFMTRAVGKDVFFLRTDVDDEASLIEGSTFRFNIVAASKGPRAVGIVRIS